MNSRNLVFTTIVLLFSLNVFSQADQTWYFSKKVNYSFEEAIEKTKLALKEQSFGIITEIPMHEKLAEKIENLNMKQYQILGACNPGFAHKTLQVEENIGLFLPCKVLVKEIDENTSEVVMVNPSYLMQMLGNDKLMGVADEVTQHFQKALENL